MLKTVLESLNPRSVVFVFGSRVFGFDLRFILTCGVEAVFLASVYIPILVAHRRFFGRWGVGVVSVSRGPMGGEGNWISNSSDAML